MWKKYIFKKHFTKILSKDKISTVKSPPHLFWLVLLLNFLFFSFLSPYYMHRSMSSNLTLASLFEKRKYHQAQKFFSSCGEVFYKVPSAACNYSKVTLHATQVNNNSPLWDVEKQKQPSSHVSKSAKNTNWRFGFVFSSSVIHLSAALGGSLKVPLRKNPAEFPQLHFSGYCLSSNWLTASGSSNSPPSNNPPPSPRLPD